MSFHRQVSGEIRLPPRGCAFADRSETRGQRTNPNLRLFDAGSRSGRAARNKPLEMNDLARYKAGSLGGCRL
jgi:hypothetical protein